MPEGTKLWKEITERYDQLNKAFYENDLEWMTNEFYESGIHMIDESGKIWKGKSEFMEFFQKMGAENMEGMELKYDTEAVDGDDEYSYQLGRTTFVDTKTNQPMGPTMANLTVWHKVDGKWMIQADSFIGEKFE